MTRAKTWAVLIFVSAALIVGGFHFGDRYGLLIGFILALSLNTLVIFYADLRLSALFPSTELEGHDPWGLLQTTAELSRRMGIKAPAIHIIQARTPTAFSAGLVARRSRLFLSEELLKKLTPDETRSVVAIELARLKRHETSAATAAAALAGILILTANIIDATIFLQVFRTRRPGQARPVALLVSPLVATLVRGAVSRRAILAADLEASQALGSREILARALWKLDSYSKTLPLDVSPAEAHLFTVNPLTPFRWCRFLIAQPATKTRVRKLTGRFPL